MNHQQSPSGHYGVVAKADNKWKVVVSAEEKSEAGEGDGAGGWRDIIQKVQTSSYKMTKFWGSNVQYGNHS